ncbi:MAG: ExbD/TolR family protein [Patiriisocius sp.]|uniref:ExbD/TolR family protein n=1 Tax=Patiriisocius sp. TaxID=2822396 RepID=UPI003EFA7C5F
MGRRATPEVNAGSMADIAFLLLIFFLVTTTIEKDKGIARQLPPKQEKEETPPPIKEKNIFIVAINRSNDMLVENELMQVEDLRQAAIEFLDNGGDGTCTYCKGRKNPASSDNPEKAVITVKNDRESTYSMYIQVQNELVGAYNFLRDRESQRLYGWKFTEVNKAIDEGSYKGNIEKAKDRLKEIQELFPMKLSEADTKQQ